MLQRKKVEQQASGADRRFQRQETDLTNCDREPIHIPGSIQAHGYLLAVAGSGEILYLSENIIDLTGRPADQLLGKQLDEFVDQEAAEQLKGILDKKNKASLPIKISNQKKEKAFDGLVHRYNGVYILELEPVQDKESRQIDVDFFNNSMQRMQESQSPESMAHVLAEEFRELTHYDRIMVYRFKEDFSGEVIAEAKGPLSTSFLGLHFPSTDIPVQARALYTKSLVRLIPDTNYEPVPILPEANEANQQDLDLSLASLRSVSPIHIQYLNNMDVKASMSVSIIRDGALWGMVACHHYEPRFVAYQKRQLCELLGRTFATLLSEKEGQIVRAYQEQIQATKANLFRNVSKANKFTEGLFKQEPGVQDLIRCGGCVISFGEEYVSLGKAPAREQVKELIKWLQKEVREEVFYSHKLPSLYAPAKDFRETGSGMLAVAISQVQREYIIWFRPELVRSVTWAGKEKKEGNRLAGGEEVLSPRKSFDAWTEQVREQSTPWLPMEVAVAKELRGVLVDVVLQMTGELKLRADILSRINRELDTSKNELDSFAYIVSHDLKEPLRGINNYASFLLEDYQGKLDSDGKVKLQTLMRLSDRMQQLIESLLHFSRMGRMELTMAPVDMGKVVAGVMDIFGQQVSTEKVQVEQPADWPTLTCDELRVSEIWMNLFSNALKYNEKPVKKLSLGYRKARAGETSPSGYVFYVTDNGIGVEERHHVDIFNIFRRLHDREAYGGGTGAGLTIVKKIVERHGGEVWLKSQPGKGTTFLFSL